jgi:hypothetical protein
MTLKAVLNVCRMFIAYTVIAAVLAALLVVSAWGKIQRAPQSVHVIHEVVGAPMAWFPWLAGCELAATAGLLVGIAWAPIGVAAAFGVVLYMVGAALAHVRVHDYQALWSPAVPLALAIAALVTGIDRL